MRVCVCVCVCVSVSIFLALACAICSTTFSLLHRHLGHYWNTCFSKPALVLCICCISARASSFTSQDCILQALQAAATAVQTPVFSCTAAHLKAIAESRWASLDALALETRQRCQKTRARIGSMSLVPIDSSEYHQRSATVPLPVLMQSSQLFARSRKMERRCSYIGPMLVPAPVDGCG